MGAASPTGDGRADGLYFIAEGPGGPWFLRFVAAPAVLAGHEAAIRALVQSLAPAG